MSAFYTWSTPLCCYGTPTSHSWLVTPSTQDLVVATPQLQSSQASRGVVSCGCALPLPGVVRARSVAHGRRRAWRWDGVDD